MVWKNRRQSNETLWLIWLISRTRSKSYADARTPFTIREKCNVRAMNTWPRRTKMSEPFAGDIKSCKQRSKDCAIRQMTNSVGEREDELYQETDAEASLFEGSN